MIERVFLIIWGLWLLLVAWAALRVFGFLIARRFQDRRWGDGSRDQKAAAVIIPVKGFDYQATPRFFDTLFAQEYENYRVIVCFESWSDPVAVWLKDELELTETHPFWIHPDDESGLRSITLVCAGIAQNEGQKVHNQRAAFEHLDEDDHVVVFADADISFKSNWLARLTAPINQETHPLSTTYRWLVPKRPTLPNQVASVINGSITTQGGSELTNVLWGGSMAIRKSVFDELEVPELLEGSLNDDLRLSKAARKAGNKIAFVRSLVLPTMIDFTWKSFFEFAKRQYTQVKFFSPILYTGTNVVLGLYALGLLSVIGALVYGYFYAWIPIAAAYVIDQFRALIRQQIYLSLFPEDGIRRKLFSAGWLEHMLTPFWMLLHWLLLISTWTQSKITWAGTEYRILSKSKTRILNRTLTAERLPVGVPGLALVSGLHDRRRTGSTQPIQPSRTAPIEPVETENTEEISSPASADSGIPAEPIESIAETEAILSSESVEGENAQSESEEKTEEPEIADAAPSGKVEAESDPEPAVPLAHPGINASVAALSALPYTRRKKRRRPTTVFQKRANKKDSRPKKSEKRQPRPYLHYSAVSRPNAAPPVSGPASPDDSVLRHPGQIPRVTLLSSVPASIRKKRLARKAAAKKRRKSALLSRKGKGKKGSLFRSSKRRQPGSCLLYPATNRPLSPPLSSETGNAPEPVLRHPGLNSKVTPLSSASTPGRKKRMVRRAVTKKKTPPRQKPRKPRALPHVLYSPYPLAGSNHSPPSGTATDRTDAAVVAEPVESRAESDTTAARATKLEGSPRVLSASHAARRTVGKSKQGKPGASALKSARSSRANQTSTNSRGRRILRRVSSGPSGRPR